MLSQFIQRKDTIPWQGMCALWMLIVLLIEKRHNCPLSKAKNILWWNRFHAMSSYWTGQIWGWNPTAGESHPQCKSHSHFPWPWSPGKPNYLNPIIWNTKGPDQKTLQLHPCSAVQCVRLSVCICGGVNEATVTCLLLAVWLIILWGLLLPHGARPVWACGRPGKRASSISPLHRRS